MLSTKTLLATLALFSTTFAAPVAFPVANPNPLAAVQPRLYDAAASLLRQIGALDDCSSAPFPSECRTAAQAATPVALGFQKYKMVGHAGDTNLQAALIGLMMYESANFQYNINHYPGNPGQGTRNMQSADFNTKYATDLYGATKVSAQGGDVDKIRALVLNDNDSFASAMWFVMTQCDSSVVDGLRTSTPDSPTGWQNYLSSCVGTTDTSERNALYKKAYDVLVAAD